jgi:sortase A
MSKKIINKKSKAYIRRKKRRRSILTTLLLVLILLLGMAIIAYPTVSDWWNSFHQSRAIASYSEAVDSASEAEIQAIFDAAEAYNASLLEKDNPFAMTQENLDEYYSLLDVSGTGVMGYIQIPVIDVTLPIYHGTSEGVLQVAIGHLDWTALPIGGESTHAVLSGHRGLPSARLFTDLDKVIVGDYFTITSLNRTVTYEVDQIRIVEPQDVAELKTVPGEDYCTLVTCTPYGINTHRMLVRGRRIDNIEEARVIIVPPGAFRIPNYIAIPAIGIPLLFLFLLGLTVYSHFKRPKRSIDELEQMLRKDREKDDEDEEEETEEEDKE